MTESDSAPNNSETINPSTFKPDLNQDRSQLGRPLTAQEMAQGLRYTLSPESMKDEVQTERKQAPQNRDKIGFKPKLSVD